ncbi:MULTISPECIES: AraC family transcriptional regulator [Stenotrophomonas]|jgi:AraC family transcriptional regulator|uniref:Helix-turn-helix transcriptional regulator n=1 Tax=Stenotrophomonas maltophilia TaxID=40324 RepID=A0AAJ3ZUJ4_STEMA|nr:MULTISPECIES: AraC family transcriptional regulator [Stenotrophomonas]MBD3740673.1 helix-turn-helix transcriptional regulator [Stenotrophomonas sp.]NED60443.1 helix-turn-helix transcriptional regulator [Streptomyces sp. SID10244]QBL41254.1 AraC family transcriptional regulator [Stenotrophomonas sp. ASS1]EKT4088546.1 helix-turn-helix transcriptional regulator [Stenotrophomonas maltophilia]EKU9960559.1 helix-turn-helix transcriptional regulator [Stenotrophomonas maltophilia]
MGHPLAASRMATVFSPDPPAVALAPQQAAALQRALRYVDEHLSQPLRVTELAAAACVSRFHLVRLFRTGTGASPLRYVRRRRIERARQLLPVAQLPMSCLAQQLGFFDQSHFVRSFRAETGCSPGQYLAGDAALLLPPDRVSNGVQP